MDTILLNAMFAGTYGEKHIDGEIINFYLDDDGVQNYFVSEYGTLPNELKNDCIKAILMVSKIDAATFEIIGKYVPGDAKCFAYKKKSKADQEEEERIAESILYADVPLAAVCPIYTSTNKSFARVSFRGGKVFFLKNNHRIILSGKKEEIENYFDCTVIQLDEYASNKWGCTNYRIFSGDGNRCYKNKEHKEDVANTYDILSAIVDDPALWIENTARVTLNMDSLDKIRNIDFLGLNHIMDGSHIELLSSNWLAHYIEMAPESFCDFFGIADMGELVSVAREKHNIDILVEFANDVVVIENKIKADIGMNSSGYSCQLEKYYIKVEEEYARKKRTYIVLCPDYEKRKIKKQIDSIKQRSGERIQEALDAYDVRTYSELKECCLKHSPLSYAKYYTDLLDFLDDHSNVSEHYKKRKLSEKRFLHTIALKL